MTRDDIIRILDWHPSVKHNDRDGLLARVERVAQAAAAAEREACMKAADAVDDEGSHNQRTMKRRIRAAIRARGQA